MEGGRDIEKGEANTRVPVDRDTKADDEQWKRAFSPELVNANSPLPSSCCIFKVPEVLRRQKKEAYEPDVVSIGPFHRGDPKFQLVEDVKKWYLKCLLVRQLPNPDGLTLAELFESLTSDGLNESLDHLTESIKKQELDKRARACFSDPCHHLIPENDFIKMLILDGCFLIELFRKTSDSRRQDDDDPIFNISCLLEYLYHDLLLLENQLPWFVLEFFYEIIESGDPRLPLTQVVIDFFKDSVADAKIFSDVKSGEHILHVLDLIRKSLVHTSTSYSTAGSTNKLSTNHTLPQRIPSAATLSEAGVKFKKAEPAGCILDIKFERGVFTIPPLAIDERTGPLFRNLMAFEQCYHSRAHKITSYAVLMDNLIDTNEDVNLLCEKEILANWLSAEDAVKFFNDLYTDTTVIDFAHQKLCQDVHEYHRDHWNRWIEKLRRDYFDTPWSTISFIAAFILLVLTFLQTVYTIQPYYDKSS